jgi:hypothetical protein
LGRDELSREDIGAIVAAREAKERNTQAKGAEQLMEILNTPQPSMSKKYTFNMTSGDDDRPDLDA